MTDRAAHRIEASDVVAMFATLVWKAQLEDALRDAMAQPMLDCLDTLRRGSPALAPGQGWQSATMLHEREAFAELLACVHRFATGILRFLRISCDALDVTGCWATVLAPGASHRTHRHPNNFLSGVYYLRTGPGANTINFHDPRPQTGIIRPPVVALTAENTDQIVVTVKNGTLLVCPAYLEHSVDANASDRERISISFNLMFPAFSETLAKPLW